jgi:CubicO group peptidase (beta-lactamase class C family)
MDLKAVSWKEIKAMKRIVLRIKNRNYLLVFVIVIAITVSGSAIAVMPSSIKATGVINQEYGADASNWDTAPFNMYTFTQTEKLFPTLMISRGDGLLAPLVYSPNQIDLSELIVSDPATGKSMTVEEMLNRRIMNHGLIAIHKGRIVHHSYRNGLSPDVRHINMSTSKSFIGMLAQIAKQKGLFKESDLASKYVPELRGKEAWKDVTVRHVWDMREGTKFVEDYDDENSDIRIVDRATGWRKRGEKDLKGLRDFVKQRLNEKVHQAGKVYNYSSIQTDILGMIIEGASGKSIAEFFEEEFWSKLGAEYDAGFGTDGFGQALAQGAISMTLPDFARAALLVLNKGRNHKGEQIVPAAFFDDLVAPNKKLKDAFKNYRDFAPNGHYRSQFWVIDAEKNQFMMIGIHGQLAYFDYDRDFALLTFGAYPIAKDYLLVDSLVALRDAILRALLSDYRGDDEDFDLMLEVDK